MANKLSFSILILSASSFCNAQSNVEPQKPIISKVTVYVPSGSLMCPHLGRMLNENFPKKEGVSNLIISKNYKYAYFDINKEALNNKDSILRIFNELGGYPVSEIKEIILERTSKK